jgi:UDP-N-acetylmuramate--alanine ligase
MRILRPLVSTTGISFELELAGQSLGQFALPVLGEHNILNAAAAVTLALELGINVETVRSALAVFRGPGRRMERKGHAAGVTVIDDYGHHPSEVRATLKALRPAAAPGRLYVIFQPHRYTRTRDLIDEFAVSFNDADVLRVVDLYAASEQPIEGVSSEALVDRIRAAGHPDVKYAGSVAAAAACAIQEARPGDTILTLGAGSITQAAGLIVRGLGKGTELGETQSAGT